MKSLFKFALISAALLVAAVLVLSERSYRNECRFKDWAGGRIKSPIKDVVIEVGRRRAVCTNPVLLRSLEAQTPAGPANGIVPKRYDSSEVKFIDGTEVRCDGGIVGDSRITFELEDRSIGFDIDSVDPDLRRNLFEYLFGSSSPGGERQF